MSNRKIWEAGKGILQELHIAGFEAYIVGGAVRDIVLGKEATDIDIATNALPEDVKKVFPKTIDVGIAHGTLVVIHQHVAIEVTTFRTDGEYDDHRRPKEVIFVRSLEEDLKRRDFTMNAMAMTDKGDIIDLYSGKQDIENRLIRTVGKPIQRFSEDALRMLRAVRFSAQLEFSLAKETAEAITNQKSDMTHISVERITKELEKIWVSNNPYLGIQQLVHTRLAENLPGNLQWQPEKWKAFRSHDSLANGWAFLSLLQDESKAVSIPTLFKLSNEQKQKMKHIKKAVNIRINGLYTNEHVFEFEEQVLLIAEEFTRILYPAVEPMPYHSIKEMKQSLPIQSSRELAVSGNDLKEWVKKPGGPWIKQMLDDLIKAVLNNEVQNHPEQIKEWIMK